MNDGSVAFLMYHELELPERSLCDSEPGYVRYVVDAAEFRAHVARLRADGARGVSVKEAFASAFAGANATTTTTIGHEKHVAMTFDDGCETDLLVAAPVLRDASFNATFYVTVEHLGRRGYLTKTQLRELADLGFEIGSHAMTHRYLHDLSDQEVHDELVGSKKALEDITGQPITQFSCPGGRWDRRVSRAARDSGYESLVTSAIGINSSETDRFRLSRVAVMRGMRAPEIARIARGEGLMRRRAQSAVLNGAKRVLGNARYEKARAMALRLARGR